jgi:ArsR family transcriptional regulator, arsenate/arsenite/antimonite-responsive transcriptional repressor
VIQPIQIIGDEDVCCLVAPNALSAEVRQLRDHLVASRDLLDALADPARQDLVQLLAREQLNVGDIASRVTLSRPTVSHHLLILKRAGLVRTRKQGREVFYRLNKAPIVNTLQGLVDSLTCC